MSEFLVLIIGIILVGALIGMITGIVWFIKVTTKVVPKKPKEPYPFYNELYKNVATLQPRKRYTLITAFIADNLSYTMIDLPSYTTLFNHDDAAKIIEELFVMSKDTRYFEYTEQSLHNVIFKVQNRLELAVKREMLSFEEFSTEGTRFSLVFRIMKVND